MKLAKLEIKTIFLLSLNNPILSLFFFLLAQIDFNFL